MTSDIEAAEHYENAAKLRYLAEAADGAERHDLLARAAAERDAGDRASRVAFAPGGGASDGHQD